MSTNKIKSYGKSVIETEISGAKKLFKSVNSDFSKAVKKLSKIKYQVYMYVCSLRV